MRGTDWRAVDCLVALTRHPFGNHLQQLCSRYYPPQQTKTKKKEMVWNEPAKKFCSLWGWWFYVLCSPVCLQIHNVDTVQGAHKDLPMVFYAKSLYPTPLTYWIRNFCTGRPLANPHMEMPAMRSFIHVCEPIVGNFHVGSSQLTGRHLWPLHSS